MKCCVTVLYVACQTKQRQKRLLTEQNLDLAKALEVAQAMEAAQKNALQFKDLSVGV